MTNFSLTGQTDPSASSGPSPMDLLSPVGTGVGLGLGGLGALYGGRKFMQSRAAAAPGMPLPDWLTQMSGRLPLEGHSSYPSYLFDPSKLIDPNPLSANFGKPRVIRGLTQEAPLAERVAAVTKGTSATGNPMSEQLKGLDLGDMGVSNSAIGLPYAETAAAKDPGAIKTAINYFGGEGSGGLRGFAKDLVADGAGAKFGTTAGASFLANSLAQAGIHSLVPDDNPMGDILGDVSTGASMAAPIGALGGPFAEVSIPLAAGIGGLAGGAYGVLDNLFGSSKEDDLTKMVKSWGTNGLVSDSKINAALTTYKQLTDAGVDPKTAQQVFTPLQEEFTAHITGGKTADEEKEQARVDFANMNQRAAGFMAPFMQQNQARMDADNTNALASIDKMGGPYADVLRANLAQTNLAGQASMAAQANPYAVLAQQFAPYLADTYLGAQQRPTQQLLSQFQTQPTSGSSQSLSNIAIQ